MKKVAAYVLAFLTLCLLCASSARAAEDFPPGIFDDGNAYSLKDLQGKAIVLFFYEQDCPKCRGLIPDKNKLVEEYADKPIKFIAVAANDTFQEARAYINSTHLKMPVFADALGLMQKRYNLQISMQNVYQFRVIDPEGRIIAFNMEKDSIDKVLASTHWKYKDTHKDERLAQAVDRFEWGQYADGVRLLKPHLKSSKKDLAAAAKTLYDVIAAEGKSWLDDADKAVTEEKFVDAFDLYNKVSNVFVGEDMGKKATEALKKVRTNKAVKDELAARAMYANLCIGMSSANERQKGAAIDFASQIASNYPLTPTGMKVKAIVDELAK